MWNPVDTSFFSKKLPIEIANVVDTCHSVMLRGLLEELGAVVLVHNIGCPQDFLKIIGQGEAIAPYLIIACHGDDNGIVFGDYMEGIDASMLVKESMPADCVVNHVKLPGCFVINLGCGCGDEKMARAFLSGGVNGYVGTDPNPNASNHSLFLAHFFHSIIDHKKTAVEAWEAAAAYDSESRLYLLYDKDGKHQAPETSNNT